MRWLRQREREEMLRWYEDKIPRDIGEAKHEVGILGIRWMVETKIEENQGDAERRGDEGW